jgi:hypothetical protein
MQINPYSAPKTSDDEPRNMPRRPTSVKLAAVFIVLNLLAGNSKFLFIDTPTAGVMTAVAFAIVLGFTALLIAAVLSRVSWARWVVTALLVASLLFFPFAIAHASLPALRIILVAQAVLQLGTLVLIFLPPSVRWYRSNNSFKPKPLRGSA